MKNTKVIIIGEDSVKSKPIEFLAGLSSDLCQNSVGNFRCPSKWENIELVCRGYNRRFAPSPDQVVDIMFAYDSGKRSDGVLFVGKFNDGVVE